MKVRISTVREFEIEVNNPAIAELDEYWRTHDGGSIDYKISNALMEKAEKAIEEITGLPFGDREGAKEIIITVCAMDGETILEN